MEDQVKIQRFIKNLIAKNKFNISKNSRALGLSRQTYQNKLDNLRKKKIITNFSININPNIRPNNLKYIFLEIKTNPKEPELVEELLKIPQLRMLDGVFGEYSLLALFIFNSLEEYYQILNIIDKIMAKSYFKKYQIIETIKVFKTNGISLRSLNLSFKEELAEKLMDVFRNESNVNYKIQDVEIELTKKIDLERIAQEHPDIKYDPRKFPGIIIQIEDTSATVLIFSTGKIIITDLRKEVEVEQLINNIILNIEKTGIKLDMKNNEQNYNIDDIDNKILNILRDGQGLKPISTYNIKEIFKEQLKEEISQSTIHNRIKVLEKNRVILNYTVKFNPRRIGFNGKFIIKVKPSDTSRYDELALKLEKKRRITHLFRIGEEYGLLAIVRMKKVEDFSVFLKDLYDSEEIEDTFTSFVLDELVTYCNFALF